MNCLDDAFAGQIVLYYYRDAQYWIFANIWYADIFQLILVDSRSDTDIFPFVWKQHQVSPYSQ